MFEGGYYNYKPTRQRHIN